MISKSMQDALNAQINLEQYSAQLYLAMSAHCAGKSFKGFAHWLTVQASEETAHAAKLIAFQQTMRDVAVPPAVQKYIVNLTSASRPGNSDALESVNKYVAWGAGVRATQYLALGAKARAAMAGRPAATIDDVKAVALPVMRHRIGVNFRAENDRVAQATIVGQLLESVKA